MTEKPFILNMTAGAINYAAIWATLAQCGLKWEMHPAQVFSLQVQHEIQNPVVLEQIIKEEDDKLMCEMIPATKLTVCGIPVYVREDMPRGWIRLMHGNKEIARIENIAVPSVYVRYDDFNMFEKREQILAEKLCQEQQELS